MKKSFILMILIFLVLSPLFSAEDIAPDINPGNIDPEKNRINVLELIYASDIPPRFGFSKARVNSVLYPPAENRYNDGDTINFTYNSVTEQYSVSLFTYVQTFGGRVGLIYTLTFSSLVNDSDKNEKLNPLISINGSVLSKTTTYENTLNYNELPEITSDEIILSVPIQDSLGNSTIKYTTPYRGTITMEVKTK